MEKKEQFERILDEAKEEIGKMKQCRHCIFANEDKTWCFDNKIPIRSQVQIGCWKHMTDQDNLEKIAREQYEKNVKDLQRMQLDLDIMGFEIAAASQTLEKLDRELNSNYNAIKEKTEECTKNHRDSKRNRDNLAKGYATMKVIAQDMRSAYNKYVEYFFSNIYTDDKGKYDWKESEKTLRNSGCINTFIRVFVDKALENRENAQKIMDFMCSLPGSGIYDEDNASKYMIK